MNKAMRTPVTREPARRPPSAFAPRDKPTMTGATIATTPGPTISRRAALVEISTQVCESGLTPSLPSSSPGISLNCRRISTTMSPAAFPTEVMVIAATTNGSPPPIKSPITTSGLVRVRSSSPGTAAVYAANSARAVRAAEPMANPLPTAAVVFPIESSSSVMARTSSPSPLISAIPPALSATGP